MSRWFRWYEGTSEDGKFRSIAVTVGVTPVTVIGTWAMILEDASHSTPRGTATRGIKFWHAVLGIDRNTCEQIINEMEALGLVTWTGTDDQLIVNKWKERQYETDVTDPTATDRQRRHRAKMKQAEHGTETPHNATVTATSRPDTESDTDKKDIVQSKKEKGSEKEKLTDEFEAFYQAYPLKKGRRAALKAYVHARSRAEPGVLRDAAIAAAKRYAGTEKQFIPWPATWLNRDSWLDEDLQPPPRQPQETVSNGKVFVAYGTDEGYAWQAYYRHKGRVPPGAGTGGYWFDSKWPPNEVVAHETSESAA